MGRPSKSTVLSTVAENRPPQFAPVSSKLLAQRFGLSLGMKGLEQSDYDRLMKAVKYETMDIASPYFMNQLFSGISEVALAADALVAETKASMATFEASPVFSSIEGELIQSLAHLFGWHAKTSEGIGVPGGSFANFMALHCARHRLRPEAKRQGIGNERFAIYVSQDAHYSWQKAAVVLGFGSESVVKVEIDGRGRMDLADLELKINQTERTPLLVAATAGTTVFGAFDDLQQLGALCRKAGVWLHVDGAWGGPVIFSQTHRNLLQGIEAADSVTFDAHKLLGVSLTSALFLTPHQGSLQKANDVSGAEYIFHDQSDVKDDYDRGPTSWQCGRRADSFAFWALWKRYGTDGLGQEIDRLMELRKSFVAWLQTQDRVELLHQPDFLNVCIRIKPPEAVDDTSGTWSLQVRERLRSENKAMVNYSKDIFGKPFLRLIIAHKELQSAHLEQIVSWALEVT